MTDISYSDGSTVRNAVIQVGDDHHCELPGFYRAFWCASPDASTGSPVVGYCSSGGSHKTIAAVVHECRKLGYQDAIYRNGRLVGNYYRVESKKFAGESEARDYANRIHARTGAIVAITRA